MSKKPVVVVPCDCNYMVCLVPQQKGCDLVPYQVVASHVQRGVSCKHEQCDMQTHGGQDLAEGDLLVLALLGGPDPSSMLSSANLPAFHF